MLTVYNVTMLSAALYSNSKGCMECNCAAANPDNTQKHTVTQDNIDNTVKEAWYVTVLLSTLISNI